MWGTWNSLQDLLCALLQTAGISHQPMQADGGLEEKKNYAPGGNILVLHAILGMAVSPRLAAIFTPLIFRLGFHTPVQLPKHIFWFCLICKRFFIPLSLFFTPGHLPLALLSDMPPPICFPQAARG